MKTIDKKFLYFHCRKDMFTLDVKFPFSKNLGYRIGLTIYYNYKNKAYKSILAFKNGAFTFVKNNFFNGLIYFGTGYYFPNKKI